MTTTSLKSLETAVQMIPDALPDGAVLGTLKRVQSTLVHGVCITVSTPGGEVLVPLDARSEKDLQAALARAREVDNIAMDMLSSTSVH